MEKQFEIVVMKVKENCTRSKSGATGDGDM